MARSDDTNALRERTRLQPQHFIALERNFTDAFIENHIQGGGRSGAQIHRAQREEGVPMSTVLLIGEAFELAQQWELYITAAGDAQAGSPYFQPVLRRAAAANGAAPNLYRYTRDITLVVSDDDGEAVTRRGRITFGRDPADNKIHHLHSTE